MLTGEGITFHRGVAVTEGREARRPESRASTRTADTGEAGEVSAAEILCAAGRLANVEGLNLEAVGVHADPEHGIEVDDLLQTHAVRVFAIGDVLLRNQYTHAAEREAEVAFQNAVLRRRRKIDYTHLPWATFLDPEVATVGISEAQAKAEELEHRVYRVILRRHRPRPDRRPDRGLRQGGRLAFGQDPGCDDRRRGGEPGPPATRAWRWTRGLGLGDLAETTQIYPTYGRVIRDLAGQYPGNPPRAGLPARPPSTSSTGSSPAPMPIDGASSRTARRSHWI